MNRGCMRMTVVARTQQVGVPVRGGGLRLLDTATRHVPPSRFLIQEAVPPCRQPITPIYINPSFNSIFLQE